MGVAQLLLKHGADAEAQDCDKCTLLLPASKREYIEVAGVLLEYGVDRVARNSIVCTPLRLASMRAMDDWPLLSYSSSTAPM